MTGMWQEYFKVSRTDPRFLSSTTDDHVVDMLGIMYRNGVQRRLTDKVAAAADHAGEIADSHERLRESIEKGPLGKAMQRFEKTRHAKPQLTTTVITVRARKYTTGE